MTSLGDQFAGCPWGDRSLQLYPATVRTDPRTIVDAAQTQVILRGRVHSHYDSPDGSGSTDRVEQTTVYVTFKRR